MTNPILENRRKLLIYLLVWALCAVCDSLLFMHFNNIKFVITLIDGLVFYLMYAPIGLGLWYVVYYADIFTNKLSKTLTNHILASVCVTTVWTLVCYFILRALYGNNTEYLDFLHFSIPWRAGMGLFLYIVFVLFYYLVIYYRNLKEKTTRESELKTLIKESELSTLKSQINPHFLFNSLNSISSLTLSNPDKAQEMVIKLSEFFRYSLGNKKEDKSSLKEELKNIDRYLDIEKTRFGDKLHYEKQVNADCLDKLLPNMILQPLFENAVKYGVYESLEQSNITLKCEDRGLFLYIQLENDYDSKMLSKKGEGIGLTNIRKRLQLVYSRNDLLKIDRQQDKFKVELLIPQNIKTN